MKLPAVKLPIGRIAPFAIQAAAILAGVGGGVWLKSGAIAGAPFAADSPPALHAAADAHGAAPEKVKKPAKEKKPEKADKHAKADAPGKGDKAKGDKGKSGHGGKGGEAGDGGFMRFSRQFVVPVLAPSGAVSSLVVLDINIEVPPGATEALYPREPKLRDQMLATLLSLSNRGAFEKHLLEKRNLDAIRAELLAAAKSVIGDDAKNVLILNITRQDV